MVPIIFIIVLQMRLEDMFCKTQTVSKKRNTEHNN